MLQILAVLKKLSQRWGILGACMGLLYLHVIEMPALQECSKFDALDWQKATQRNKKLAVKGVFGSSCRHQFPLKYRILSINTPGVLFFCGPLYMAYYSSGVLFESGVLFFVQYFSN